jgi:hypothetical protein
LNSCFHFNFKQCKPVLGKLWVLGLFLSGRGSSYRRSLACCFFYIQFDLFVVPSYSCSVASRLVFQSLSCVVPVWIPIWFVYQNHLQYYYYVVLSVCVCVVPLLPLNGIILIFFQLFALKFYFDDNFI